MRNRAAEQNYFAALIQAPLWALPTAPFQPAAQAPVVSPSRFGIGAAADDYYQQTATNIREICDNPKWYDWINPGIWALCLPGDVANVHQAVTGDYGRPVVTTPAGKPPAAPQTRPKLITWTPEDIDEAQAQKQAQYRIDMEAIQRGNGQMPIDPSAPLPGDDFTLELVLGAVALTGIGIAIFSRRK